MSVETAQELFVSQLKDIYSAEKQAVKAYPRLTKPVQSDELRQAMQEHLEQTKGQIERLDRIFEILGERSSGKTCKGMQGLVEEAQSEVEEIEKGPVLDAALIAALQRVEHYEIAAYGTVATLAEAMGQDEIKQLLGETLQEEKETDERLTEVAESVNSEALSEREEDEEDQEDVDAEDEEESGSSGSSSTRSSKKSVKRATPSRSNTRSKKSASGR